MFPTTGTRRIRVLGPTRRECPHESDTSKCQAQSVQIRSTILKRVDADRDYLENSKDDLRVVQYGRHVYVLLYIVTGDTPSVEQLDVAREEVYGGLREELHYFSVDIAFTTDAIWIERSVKKA